MPVNWNGRSRLATPLPGKHGHKMATVLESRAAPAIAPCPPNGTLLKRFQGYSTDRVNDSIQGVADVRRGS